MVLFKQEAQKAQKATVIVLDCHHFPLAANPVPPPYPAGGPGPYPAGGPGPHPAGTAQYAASSTTYNYQAQPHGINPNILPQQNVVFALQSNLLGPNPSLVMYFQKFSSFYSPQKFSHHFLWNLSTLLLVYAQVPELQSTGDVRDGIRERHAYLAVGGRTGALG